MTKKLEELLNLPESQEIVQEEQAKSEAQDKQQEQKAKSIQAQKETMRDIAEFDKIAAALPKVDGLGEMGDTELDDISNRASTAYEDLMDLGMNVDSRYSGRIFEVASTMLRNAIDAKGSKIDKKLKMVELQLKKLKIDKTGGDDTGPVEESEGFVISDRNELMKKLLKKDNTEDSKKD